MLHGRMADGGVAAVQIEKIEFEEKAGKRDPLKFVVFVDGKEVRRKGRARQAGHGGGGVG